MAQTTIKPQDLLFPERILDPRCTHVDLVDEILVIITTWRGITCRIAITIEGVENVYLPGNVHFQYRP